MRISRSFMKKLATVTILGIAIAALNDRPAKALTQTANLGVSASINAACTIATLPVNFGTYSPASSSTGSGSVDVTCTLGAAVWVTLDQGQHQAGGSTLAAPARQMSSGSDVLAYSLSGLSSGGAEWGGTQPTGITATGNGATAVSLSVYGTIPAGQGALSGAYTDTVVATVNY